MVGTGGIIPTRSRAQAREWSLVLLSEGIESAIDGPPDQTGSQIEVDPIDFSRAVRILRQYIIENKQGPVPQFGPTDLIFNWANAWFFVLLAVMFVLQATVPSLSEAGRMDGKAFLTGQWWRPFTAVLLHHDFSHLAANLVIGVTFVSLASGLFGAVRAFLISYSAAVAAYIGGCAINMGSYRSLGASGMVMGALGLITAHSLFHHDGTFNRRRAAFRGFAAGMMLLVLLGFNPQPQTDVLAHVIGFVFGLGMGTATLLYRMWWRRPIRSQSL